MTLTANNTIQERYAANYQRIAREHVAYARAHDGQNPFMEPALVETLEQATVELVRRYVTPGSLVLDAGCGPGTLLNRLDGYERYGYDISDDYLAYVRDTQPSGSILSRVNLEDIPDIDGFFDAVVCADVLEHVLDEHQVLRELIRVLKPGGHLIIRVPQEDDLSVYTQRPREYEYVHLRRFDRPTLQLLLVDTHGLRIEEISRVEYPGWDELHAVAVRP